MDHGTVRHVLLVSVDAALTSTPLPGAVPARCVYPSEGNAHSGCWRPIQTGRCLEMAQFCHDSPVPGQWQWSQLQLPVLPWTPPLLSPTVPSPPTHAHPLGQNCLLCWRRTLAARAASMRILGEGASISAQSSWFVSKASGGVIDLPKTGLHTLDASWSNEPNCFRDYVAMLKVVTCLYLHP